MERDGLGTIRVMIEASAGHRQPSSAAQHRRLWIEVVTYDQDDAVVFESGRVADDEPVQKSQEDPDPDPQLAPHRDFVYDAQGEPTHDFWKAAPSAAHPDGYESYALPFANDPAIPHTLGARYAIARHREIARMTVRLRMRAIDLDVLQELVDGGDLDASVLPRMPTFTLHGAAVEWRPEAGTLRSLLPAAPACPEG